MEYQIKYTEFLARHIQALQLEFFEIANMALSIGMEEDIVQERIQICNQFLDFYKAIQSPFTTWTNKEVEIGIDYWTNHYRMYNRNLLLSPDQDFEKISKQVIEGVTVIQLPDTGYGNLVRDTSGNVYWQPQQTVIDLGNI
jgi:hypothetical protein